MREVNKLKLSGYSCEIAEPLDPNKRTLLTIECDIRSVERPVPDSDEQEVIFKAKVNGSTIIQQAGLKEKIVGKSKRTESQKWKANMWHLNPTDEFYYKIMGIMNGNPEAVVEFLEKL